MSVQNFVVKALRESMVTNYKIMQETGISDQTIANYRDGKTAPKGVNLQILAKYLGIANYSNDAPVIRKIPFYDDLATNTVTDRRVSKKVGNQWTTLCRETGFLKQQQRCVIMGTQ